MRKYGIFCLIILILAVVLPAMADSVWMPMDDYFMDPWKPDSDNTCDFQERPYYLAAGEKGYVTAVKTPLDQTHINSYPNGTEFKIAFVCGSGNNLWGAVEAVRTNGETVFKEDWQGTSGYISMSDLVRAYDSDAFVEDHRESVYAFDESAYDLCSSGEFVVWETPNSGVQMEYISQDYLSYLCMEFNEEYKPFHFGGFYYDLDGNRWVEVTLRRPSERGWINLDSPTSGGVKPVY